MIRIRRGTIQTALLILVIAISGCSSAPAARDPDIDLYAAKAVVLAEAARIVGRLPARYVEGYNQKTEAHLMRCSGGKHNWPGHGRILLRGDPNISQLFDEVAEAYKWPGFTPERRIMSDGSPKLSIRAASGAAYILSASDDGASIRLTSLSSCFALKEGQSVFDRY